MRSPKVECRRVGLSDRSTESNPSARASSRVRSARRAVRSVFGEEKKRSIAASSHTLPDRLIEQVTPCSAIGRWKTSRVDCDP